MSINFTVKCKNCGKIKGYHKAKTLACPTGKKSRIGYLSFSMTMTFEPVEDKGKKEVKQVVI